MADNKPQLVLLFVLSSLFTHVLGQIQLVSAAGGSAANSQSSGETTSSSQPLWSYQAKPSNYISASQIPTGGHYGASGGGQPSIFDAFNGLSQRQSALSGSPFLSILPIILIAAGGMLLLLPFLTMMMASPFSGGGAFGGGYNGGFGYPQVGALSKKRSLFNDQLGQASSNKGLLDVFESFSSTIEELSRKYSAASGNQPNKLLRSAKLNSPPNETPASAQHHPSNHKLTNGPGEEQANSNSANTT